MIEVDDSISDFDVVYDQMYEIYYMFHTVVTDSDIQTISELVSEYTKRSSVAKKSGISALDSLKKTSPFKETNSKTRYNKKIADMYAEIDKINYKIRSLDTSKNMILINIEDNSIIFKEITSKRKIEVLEEKTLIDNDVYLVAVYYKMYDEHNKMIADISEYRFSK